MVWNLLFQLVAIPFFQVFTPQIALPWLLSPFHIASTPAVGVLQNKPRPNCCWPPPSLPPTHPSPGPRQEPLNLSPCFYLTPLCFLHKAPRVSLLKDRMKCVQSTAQNPPMAPTHSEWKQTSSQWSARFPQPAHLSLYPQRLSDLILFIPPFYPPTPITLVSWQVHQPAKGGPSFGLSSLLFPLSGPLCPHLATWLLSPPSDIHSTVTFSGRLPKHSLQNCNAKTSRVVQWLSLWAPNAAGPGSIPGQGTRSHMPQLRVQIPQLKFPWAATKDLSATTKTSYS